MVTLPVSCLAVILGYLWHVRAEQILVTAVIGSTHCARVGANDLLALAHKVAVILPRINMLGKCEELAAPADVIDLPLVAEVLAVLSRWKVKGDDVDICTTAWVTHKAELTIKSCLRERED